MYRSNMLEAVPKFIPEEKVREIRESCSISEIISDYVSLKKIGTNFRGLCPFHNEKTPSFFVNEDRKFFNCFGCGTRGDVFTFLMKHENMSFQETARFLSKRTGISLPERILSPQQKKRLSEREEYFRINEITAGFYHNILLKDKKAEGARNYLTKRGINLETIQEYCLGFAPEGWDAVVRMLGSKNIALQNAQKLGLIISKESGRYYDRFRKRIIFPIYNVSHNIIGFGGRIIDKGEPKYLNSPESSVYSKRQSLYGLQAASRHIKTENKVIIVEGYLDLLMLHQAGIKNVVAALGTALTEQQILILKRYTSKIITVFDSDPSGEKAMVRSLEPFLKSSVSPLLVLLPEGDDPDSFVCEHGKKAFLEKIDGAGFLLDFVVEKIIQKNQVTAPREKINACEEIIPFLKLVTDEMERDLYVQKVSQKLGVKETHIYSKMGMASSRKSFVNNKENTVKAFSSSKINTEKLILALLISCPETFKVIDKELLIEEFLDPDLKGLGKLLCAENKKHGKPSIPDIMGNIEKENWKELMIELSFHDCCQGDPVKTLEDCIRDLRLKKSWRERKKIRVLLEQAETARDEALSLKYQHAYQSLLQKEKKIQCYKLNFHQN